MTNQIPEEDRKKISDLANAYGIVPAFSNQTRIDHDRILHYIAGATGGYILGLQSAEKRVKDLEDVLKDCNEYLSHETYEKGKPVHLNYIGSFSILHQKIIKLLSK